MALDVRHTNNTITIASSDLLFKTAGKCKTNLNSSLMVIYGLMWSSDRISRNSQNSILIFFLCGRQSIYKIMWMSSISVKSRGNITYCGQVNSNRSSTFALSRSVRQCCCYALELEIHLRRIRDRACSPVLCGIAVPGSRAWISAHAEDVVFLRCAVAILR